jgi:hypothetical protein
MTIYHPKGLLSAYILLSMASGCIAGSIAIRADSVGQNPAFLKNGFYFFLQRKFFSLPVSLTELLRKMRNEKDK